MALQIRPSGLLVFAVVWMRPRPQGYRRGMGGWEGLRVELRRLILEAPDALMAFPDPESEPTRTPVRIMLAAWATEIAAGLHARYPELVELHVGAMRFPARELLRNVWVPELRGEPAADLGFDVEALAPLTVRSGWDARRDVLVTNRSARDQVLFTMGELSSVVTDSSGRVVGRFAGPQPLPLVGFAIGAQESRPVPVLIGTASMVPQLGYAVPPGRWSLVIALQTETGEGGLASLELTVTP
ncbi:hypothetical protein GCM10010530_11770 [Kribbella aluminosa]